MADTINDVMYTALKDAGFDDNVTAMLLNWQRSLDINGWTAYVEHVMANTTAEHFADAEYEFWVNYTGEEPPSFTPADLSPALWIDPSDAATVTISGSSGAYIGPNGLVLPGSTNYAESPHLAAYDITGDIDIIVKATATDWTPAAYMTIAAHRVSGNGWAFYVDQTTGKLAFTHAAAVADYVSTVATGLTDGTTKWVRATWDNLGEVKFYLSDDGTSWTQLGTTVAASTLALTAVTTPLRIGVNNSAAQPFIGTIHRAIIKNGIDGTTVFDADFENATPFVSAFTESALGAPVYVMSSTATSATANYSYIGPEGLVCPGSANVGNYAQAADSAALSITGDIDVIVKAKMPTWSGMTFVTKDSTSRTFGFYIASDGRFTLDWWDSGGTLTSATSTVSHSIANGAEHWIRFTLDVNNGAGGYDLKFYTSTDGTSWTQLGATVVGGAPTSIRDGTDVLGIGGRPSAATTQPVGVIYRTIIKNGIDGTVAFDADFTTTPDYATSFTESSTNAATVTITATNTPANAAGALVSQIDDKSGNARHLTQGTAANMPKYWNGRNGNNCLVFDGTNDNIASATNITMSQPISTMTVFRERTVTGTQANVVDVSSVIFYRSAAGKVSAYAGVPLLGPDGDTAWHNFVAEFNGASSSIRRDGVTAVTGNAATSGTSAASYKLSLGSGSVFGGEVGEAVLCVTPTTTLRDSWDSYVRTKWSTP